MMEMKSWQASDGKKFFDELKCIQYETQKKLEDYKDDFQFFNYLKEPIPVEEAIPEEVMYIIVKSDNCTEAIGDWFDCDGCLDPFDGVYNECVGTWVYGDVIDRSDIEWFKLESEIEKMQALINAVNQ